MANHEGYIFIAVNGMYLEQTPYAGHGNDTWSYNFTPFLDSATLFPTAMWTMTRHGNWKSIIKLLEETLNKVVTRTSVKNYFTVLPAKSFQRIEIQPARLADDV